MSRSIKRTPIFGNTTAVSEKQNKRTWNKAFRRVAKILILKDKDVPVKVAAVADVWGGNKDGKHYAQQHSAKDMRK